MNAQALHLTREALWLVLTLSAPPILAAAAVGLTVAVLQAATQIQEQSVQYLLKFVAVVLTLFLTASMLGGSLYYFAGRILADFPGMVR